MVSAHPIFSTRTNLDCDSCEYPTSASHDPLWSDDDPTYSNQLETGTCVRHAIAKALALEPVSDNTLGIKPKDLMNLLLTARPDKGAGGATPMDWDLSILSIQSQKDGNIYDCEISVREIV